LTSPITVPQCKTTAPGLAQFDDGPPRKWKDDDGEERAACVFEPKGEGARPLLVFLHGSLGSAGSLYDHTSLRGKAEKFDLSGDPTKPGFILASMQGRNLYLPWEPNFSGSHHDQWYRDFESPSCNPDIRSLDRLIDDLVAKGRVDRSRIYVSGWSNGAFFATQYAIARHTTATPGGNHVAAAVLYAGADPYDNLSDTQTPSCKLARYPASTAPMMMVHRSCDALVACDAAQNAKFKLPPGGNVEQWMRRLRADVGDNFVDDVLIDRSGHRARACEPALSCSPGEGLAAHLSWPNGLMDHGGVDWENDMLSFLKSHPHR
jgi:poly(3-hydroxybutyrate) depolymerase